MVRSNTCCTSCNDTWLGNCTRCSLWILFRRCFSLNACGLLNLNWLFLELKCINIITNCMVWQFKTSIIVIYLIVMVFIVGADTITSPLWTCIVEKASCLQIQARAVVILKFLKIICIPSSFLGNAFQTASKFMYQNFTCHLSDTAQVCTII